MANVPDLRDTYRLEDLDLKGSDALPTADGTSYGAEIALSGITAALGLITAKGAHLAEFEAVLSVPAIGTTPLPSGDTITFSLMGDATAVVDSGSTVIAAGFAVITGNGSAYPANVDVGRVKIPSDCGWATIGLRAVAAGGTGDISGIDMTLSLAF